MRPAPAGARRRHRHAGPAHRHRADRARCGRRRGGCTCCRARRFATVIRAGKRRRSACVFRGDDLQPRARLGAPPRRARRPRASTSTCPSRSSTISPPIQEAKNQATEHGDRMKVLMSLLRGYNVAPPDRPGPESAEVAAALRSLGYVSGSAPARHVFTEADDPKRLVKIDRDLHTAAELFRSGRRDGGDRHARQCDRAAPRHRGCLHLAGLCVLASPVSPARRSRRSRRR